MTCGQELDWVFLGLTITSSWGNGHASTYRSLIRELSLKGHRVHFLERDVPWYAALRDLPKPGYCRTSLYRSLTELKSRHAKAVRRADAVIVGSYVPEGVEVGRWVQETARGLTAFYDIDTPVTLARMERGDHEYLKPELIPGYGLYLSFTGGPTLRRLEVEFGSPAARPLYGSVDPGRYYPVPGTCRWDLGYMGAYSEDRQPRLESMLLEPARRWAEGRFIVAGPQYPTGIAWPLQVERMENLPPDRHRDFYNAQRFTLNITRDALIRAGYSPSVRLFEAAACGTPLISDAWAGLDHFFEPGREILVPEGPEQVLDWLLRLDEGERKGIAARARSRVLAAHTAAHRAAELAGYVRERLGCR